MSKKKTDQNWWLFSRARQCWIDDADRLSAQSHELVRHFEIVPHTKEQCRDFTRAARMLQKCAKLYRNAGLGVMAVASWEEAAEAWASLGDDECAEHCEARAAEIHTYWDEPVNDKESEGL